MIIEQGQKGYIPCWPWKVKWNGLEWETDMHIYVE
jgi:hypothetical protein